LNRSIPKRGTTFTLYFPITRESLADDQSAGVTIENNGNGETILVVDDIEEQRQIATLMLKKLGYDVNSVPGGEEAIQYMQNNAADLIVLDMIMDPGIDGLETYKQILQINPDQKDKSRSKSNYRQRVFGNLACQRGTAAGCRRLCKKTLHNQKNWTGGHR
jgi:hypothetical protein